MKTLLKTLLFTITIFTWLLTHYAKANAPIDLGRNVLGRKDINTGLNSLVNNQYTEPMYLQIPSVNIKASVERVGLETDGAMEVPKEWDNVGWYKKSSKVSQEGNLLISGHFDTNTASPAVFYNLEDVIEGDNVYLYGSLPGGRQVVKKYKITSKFLADPNNFDHIKYAFRKTERPTITLITCNGIWNPAKQEYSERLVVQGRLVD